MNWPAFPNLSKAVAATLPRPEAVLSSAERQRLDLTLDLPDSDALTDVFFTAVLDIVLSRYMGPLHHWFQVWDRAAEQGRVVVSMYDPKLRFTDLLAAHERAKADLGAVATINVEHTGVLLVVEKGARTVTVKDADLRIALRRQGRGWHLYLDFDAAVCASRPTEYFATAFARTASHFGRRPDLSLADAPAQAGDEREILKSLSMGPVVDHDIETTLIARFERQVDRTPDHIAVQDEDEALAYSAFNARVNRLAWRLIEAGVGPGDCVGIHMDRSVAMLCAIYATLKAGAAYVPLIKAFPLTRCRAMLEDSAARLLLSDGAPWQDSAAPCPVWDASQPSDETLRDDNPPLQASAGDLAYIIYTSGSTGMPKGVMIEHRSVLNRIDWMQSTYPLHINSVILQKTPISFDVSVWELFWVCFTPARLYLLAHDAERDPDALLDAIESQGVTTLHFVPSMLDSFLFFLEMLDMPERLASVETVFASGEALSATQVTRFKSLVQTPCGSRLVNLYGPTEATVDVTHFDTSSAEIGATVPIGVPIDNIATAVVAPDGHLSPFGGIGELVLCGVGVARGYKGREELTAEKFAPLSFDGFNLPERSYRTGDLVRWRTDGRLDYLGRNDSQVKLRGYRIETGEIESCLRQLRQIRDSHVTVVEDQYGVPSLVAFVIVSGDSVLEPDQVTRALSETLPDYMLPSKYVSVTAFPLNYSAKLDRKALIAAWQSG